MLAAVALGAAARRFAGCYQRFLHGAIDCVGALALYLGGGGASAWVLNLGLLAATLGSFSLASTLCPPRVQLWARPLSPRISPHLPVSPRWSSCGRALLLAAPNTTHVSSGLPFTADGREQVHPFVSCSAAVLLACAGIGRRSGQGFGTFSEPSRNPLGSFPLGRLSGLGWRATLGSYDQKRKCAFLSPNQRSRGHALSRVRPCSAGLQLYSLCS